MSNRVDMEGAHTCAIAQAGMEGESILTIKPHSIHVGGHVNVWVCGYCFRSTKGAVTLTSFPCSKCGAQLP
jgi:hypothetical protein